MKLQEIIEYEKSKYNSELAKQIAEKLVILGYGSIKYVKKEKYSFFHGVNVGQSKAFEWVLRELKKIEQKPIIPKFRVGDEIKTANDANEESLTITKIDEKGYWSEDLFICDFDEDCYWDLVEQKPTTWSEDDENNLTDICVAIRKFYHGSTNGAQELIDWLNQRVKITTIN